MNEREAEKFVLEQLKRNALIYSVCRKVFIGVFIAFVLLVLAAIATGRPLTISIGLILMSGFYITTFMGLKGMQTSAEAAANEVQQAIDDPTFNIPEDYSDLTMKGRENAIVTIRSMNQLVIAYGIIAVMLWGFGLLFLFLLLSDFDPDAYMIFVIGLVAMFSMAVPLTYLTVIYFKDLPSQKKFQELYPKE